MPDAAIQLRDRAAQVGCQLRLSQSGVEVLSGRLQHEEVRSAAVFVVATGEFLGLTQSRQDFAAHRVKILAGLNELRVSVADVERDLITNRHVLPHGLFPLSVGDRDAALIAIEDGNGKTQARPRLEAATSSSTVRIVDRVKIHELILSQASPLTGGLNGNLGGPQVRPHGEGLVDECIRIPRCPVKFRLRNRRQLVAKHPEPHDRSQSLASQRHIMLSTLRSSLRLQGINPRRREFQLADVTGVEPLPSEVRDLLPECCRLPSDFGLLARGNEVRMSHTGITNHVQPVLHHRLCDTVNIQFRRLHANRL